MKALIVSLVAMMSLASCGSWPVATAPQPNETLQLTEASKQQLDSLMAKNEMDVYMVMADEQILYQSGPTGAKFNAASVRKSIISALFGMAAEKGLIDLDATLDELGIDEPSNPLTDQERQATVRHLLQARSGIYLPSIGESQGMRERRPAREQYVPGEYFYYNNWDFNVLGTVFEQETKLSIGEAFKQWIADPTGMEDFSVADVKYQHEPFTAHRMYRFYISARDLLRFGSIFMNEGRWQNQQIVPVDWVRESLKKVSEVDYSPYYDGYAYLWWVDSDEQLVWADGSGGQLIGLDFTNKLVIVTRNNTGRNAIERLWYRWFSTFAPANEGYDLLAITRSGLIRE